MNKKLIEALEEISKIDELLAITDTLPTPVVGNVTTTDSKKKDKKEEHEKKKKV